MVPSYRRLILGVTACLLAVYVLGYLHRSLNGCYEPSTLGLGHVKHYRWMPQGFVVDDKWNFSLMRFYYPLHRLDVDCWHTEARMDSGLYPAHRIAPHEVGKLWQRWHAQ